MYFKGIESANREQLEEFARQHQKQSNESRRQVFKLYGRYTPDMTFAEAFTQVKKFQEDTQQFHARLERSRKRQIAIRKRGGRINYGTPRGVPGIGR